MANPDDAIYVGLSPEWRDILFKCQNEWRVCTRCIAHYKEIENIGKWNCHQHAVPAMVIDNRRYKTSFETGSRRGTTWPCCGLDEYSTDACVPADHTNLPRGLIYTESDDIPLLSKLQHLVEPVKKESIVTTIQDRDVQMRTNQINLHTNDYVVIRRYDSRKTREIVRKIIPEIY